MSEKKTERLYIRTTPTLKAELERLADKRYRGNINLLVHLVLSEHVKVNGGSLDVE